MTRGRLLIAGSIAASAMMAGTASAQNCPEWLTVACPGETLNVPTEEVPQAEQPPRGRATGASRTKPATPAAAGTTANPNPQQAQAPAAARPARAARPAMNAQEKAALFQQFLVWREERRQNAEPSR